MLLGLVQCSAAQSTESGSLGWAGLAESEEGLETTTDVNAGLVEEMAVAKVEEPIEEEEMPVFYDKDISVEPQELWGYRVPGINICKFYYEDIDCCYYRNGYLFFNQTCWINNLDNYRYVYYAYFCYDYTISNWNGTCDYFADNGAPLGWYIWLIIVLGVFFIILLSISLQNRRRKAWRARRLRN